MYKSTLRSVRSRVMYCSTVYSIQRYHSVPKCKERLLMIIIYSRSLYVYFVYTVRYLIYRTVVRMAAVDDTANSSTQQYSTAVHMTAVDTTSNSSTAVHMTAVDTTANSSTQQYTALQHSMYVIQQCTRCTAVHKSTTTCRAVQHSVQ